MGTDNDGNSSDLLNLAPTLNSFSTPALGVGQSFVDPTAGVTLQTVSVGATGATVSINFSVPVCVHANPTVSISPVQSAGVAPGVTVNYTLTAVNNDNVGCVASAFNLTPAVPSGWKRYSAIRP